MCADCHFPIAHVPVEAPEGFGKRHADHISRSSSFLSKSREPRGSYNPRFFRLKDGSGRLKLSRALLLCEKLAEIEDGQRAWDLNSLADLNDRKIPSRDFVSTLLNEMTR